MLKENLYWEFDLEIRSFTLFGSTIRVYREKNRDLCSYYRVTEEEVQAIILINGKRSWDEILDLWMENRDSIREEEVNLKAILDEVRRKCRIRIRKSYEEVEREVVHFINYNDSTVMY